jgi:hypothetical protein
MILNGVTLNPMMRHTSTWISVATAVSSYLSIPKMRHHFDWRDSSMSPTILLGVLIFGSKSASLLFLSFNVSIIKNIYLTCSNFYFNFYTCRIEFGEHFLLRQVHICLEEWVEGSTSFPGRSLTSHQELRCRSIMCILSRLFCRTSKVHSEPRTKPSSKPQRPGRVMGTEAGVAELTKGCGSSETIQRKSYSDEHLSIINWSSLKTFVKHKSL